MKTAYKYPDMTIYHRTPTIPTFQLSSGGYLIPVRVAYFDHSPQVDRCLVYK